MGQAIGVFKGQMGITCEPTGRVETVEAGMPADCKGIEVGDQIVKVRILDALQPEEEREQQFFQDEERDTLGKIEGSERPFVVMVHLLLPKSLLWVSLTLLLAIPTYLHP